MDIETADVDRVIDLVRDLARRDVSGLSKDRLIEVHERVARLGRVTDALAARFAGEIALRSAPDHPEGSLARERGFGDAGKMISRVTGGSMAGARRAIEAGGALVPVPVTPSADADAGQERHHGADAGQGHDNGADASGGGTAPRYPAVAEAALAGDLSVDAAGLITTGLNQITDRLPADELHAIERRLVEKAVGLAAHEVRRMVARAVARVDVAAHEERERRRYEERHLTWTGDHRGVVTFTGRLDAVTAAPIRTAIEQIVTAQFRARRSQDPLERDQRSVGQMRADALAQLCRHAIGCRETGTSGIRTTIVVRMDLSDLQHGRGLGSIDGTDALVSVGQLRRLAGDAGIIPSVLGGESEVLDHGRTVRLFTRAQRTALLERDGGCARCYAPPEHCEAHHIRWWQHGGGSDLSNGVMLCTRCHHDVHRQGWEIVVHGGRVSFIPPPDIDPDGSVREGGRHATEIDVDVGDARTPFDELGEDFFADDEDMIRFWMSGEVYSAMPGDRDATVGTVRVQLS